MSASDAAAAIPSPAPRYRRPQDQSLTFFGGLPMWAKLTAFLGFPIVACAAMGAAGWSALSWTAENVAKPVITTHVQTLGNMTDTQTKLAGAFDQQTQLLSGMNAELREIRKGQERIEQAIRDGNRQRETEKPDGPGGLE